MSDVGRGGRAGGRVSGAPRSVRSNSRGITTSNVPDIRPRQSDLVPQVRPRFNLAVRERGGGDD